LPSLNEYIGKINRNRFGGNVFKQHIEDNIMWCLKKVKHKVTSPSLISFTWYEQTYKRDKDNVASAKKYILDAMQKADILPNDNNKFIAGFQDHFVYKQGNKVVIEITEKIKSN